MQTFLLSLMVKALQNETVREFLFKVVDRLADRLLPKLASLIPTSAAAVLKLLTDKIPSLPDIGDLGQITHEIHDQVNAAIPDIDIPFISDAVKDVTGFDLTDLLKGR